MPRPSPSHRPLDASRPILILPGTKAGLCHGVLGTRGSLQGSEGSGWGPGGCQCRSRAARPALCGGRAPAQPPLCAPPPAQPQPRRAAGILLGRQKPPQPSGHGAPQGSTETRSALCAGAEVSGDGAAFFFLSTALPAGPGVPQGQPCSLYCSSPTPAQHKQAHVSSYLFIFPPFPPPPPPVLSNRRPIQVQTGGAGVGQPLSNFTLSVAGLQPATPRQKGCH